MAKESKGNTKNAFRRAREAMNLSREEACDLLETISLERLNRIEREVFDPYPEEVLTMASKYQDPTLWNYYCSQKCPIGQKHVPEVKLKALSQIALEILASLNSMEDHTNRFVDIVFDGEIGDEELADFVDIQMELERISVTVEALQLWCEQMLETGKINKNKYEALLQKYK